MKKTFAAVAALTLTATLAFAGPGEGRRGGGKHGKGDFAARFAEKLNLTEAQKTQIEQLQASFRAENEPLRAQSRQLHEEFKAAREANDTARVEALKAQFKTLREQMNTRKQAQHERILSVLNADQRAQLEALKAERKAKRGARGQWKDRSK